MLIKFNTLQDLTSWLFRTKKLNNRLSIKGYLLYYLKFETKSELIDWLEVHSIIEIIHKSNIITDGFIFKNYNYEIEYIILNTNHLQSLESNSYINPNHKERLLTIKEVCQMLNLTKPSVYKLFNTNQLPYYEILSQRKVKHTDLIKFIDSKIKK
jgi:excisionase family DNA binding protein